MPLMMLQCACARTEAKSELWLLIFKPLFFPKLGRSSFKNPFCFVWVRFTDRFLQIVFLRKRVLLTVSDCYALQCAREQCLGHYLLYRLAYLSLLPQSPQRIQLQVCAVRVFMEHVLLSLHSGSIWSSAGFGVNCVRLNVIIARRVGHCNTTMQSSPCQGGCQPVHTVCRCTTHAPVLISTEK